MHFMLAAEGWRVTFLEEDLKTPLPRKMIFHDSIKHGMTLGRGSAWLNLTGDQYAKLKKGQ